jgi:hypothetical protein
MALAHSLFPVAEDSLRLRGRFDLSTQAGEESQARLPSEPENYLGKVFIDLWRSDASA